MDRHMTIWHTDAMPKDLTKLLSAELQAALRESQEADAVAAAKKERLFEIAAKEVGGGAKLADVAKLLGIVPETVRRYARKHGVKPAVYREPPARPKPPTAP